MELVTNLVSITQFCMLLKLRTRSSFKNISSFYKKCKTTQKGSSLPTAYRICILFCSVQDLYFSPFCQDLFLEMVLEQISFLDWIHLVFTCLQASPNKSTKENLFRFADDIEMMTGKRPELYWLICWKYLSPLAMISILIASIVEIATDGSGYPAWIASEGRTERHEWPVWAIVLIVILVLICVMWIPLVAICR